MSEARQRITDVQQRTVAWFRAHPSHADALLTLLLLAVIIPTGLAVDPHSAGAKRDADGWWVLLILVTVVPVAFRRRTPTLAFVVSLSGLFLVLGATYNDAGAAFATLICAYSVALYDEPRRARWVLASVVPALAVFFYLGSIRGVEGANVGNLLGNYILFGGGWFIASMVRTRRQRVAELEERNARMERERERLAQDAVASERAAIARELHDVVAHAVSVMVVQAGGARRIATAKPEQAAAALGVIEDTGREALQELRRLVGVLRESDGDVRTPQPRLAQVADLVHADPSLPVELHVEGDPVDLPASVDVSAYRIVQEALTNVRKHAGKAHAAVTVRYTPDDVEIEVVDDGRGAAADRTDGGHGLVGMRERVVLCGGELHVGPRVGGGWRVRARLPRAGAPV